MSALDAAAAAAAGWSPLHLAAGTKGPPPAGYTGYRGRYVTVEDLGRWDWSGNMAIRLPSDVIGIDVDAYNGGKVSLDALTAAHGPLPSTVMSTSRDDGSGIRLYRVPVGTLLLTDPAPGIDMIQAHHRYMVVPPSTHPDLGTPYRLIDEQSGEISEQLPEIDDLPDLPWPWLEGLKSHKSMAIGDAATPGDARRFIDEHDIGTRLGSLDAAIGTLDGIAAGGRHDALVRVACWLAREVAAGWYPGEAAFGRLYDWWVGVVDEDRARGGEYAAAVLWAIGQALADPDRVDAMRPTVTSTTGPSLSTPFAVDLDDADDWVDSHLGQALADHLRPTWCYVTAWKGWLRWDGRRWNQDGGEQVHDVARRWVVNVGDGVLRNVTTAKDPRVAKVLGYRSVMRQDQIVKVARRILAVEPDAFDVDRDLLNAANGVVNLRTGRLGPHDPALMMTRLAAAAYDPDARHPDVDAVLGCLDPGDVAAVMMLLGVAATGHTGGDHLPVFDGKGSNGKTTLLTAATSALGDYAAPVPGELVMRTNGDEHPAVKATLRGRRLAYVEETEEDGGLRLERVKAITGGGAITARVLYGQWFTFEPSHTLVIATNHRPVVNSAEHATWRRLHLVPFHHRYGTGVSDRPVDVGLRDRLHRQEQRDAMLAAIVEGAVAAYNAGDPGGSPAVTWSPGITAATAEWRSEEDVFGRFAESELTFAPGERVSLKQMFERYRGWCIDAGRPPGQDKSFARRFEDHELYAVHGVERVKPQNRITYVGVKLR